MEKIKSYRAIHYWVQNNYGKPRYCEICKRTDRKKYDWANKDHKYRKNREDYLRLCTSCHKRYDIKFNDYKMILPKRRRKRSVIQKTLFGEIIKIWDSIKDTRLMGFDTGSICRCCRGTLKTHKKYTWEYAN